MKNALQRLCAMLAFTMAGLCHAGGSVDFDVVDRLLRSQTVTHQWFSSTLEFPETADAGIRFGNHFTHLGGARMGPYTFRAKTKAPTKPGEIDVLVCTNAEFHDTSGKKIKANIEQAVRIEEKLAAILLRDARNDVEALVCPTP